MKHRRNQPVERRAALYRALNDRLDEADDIAAIEAYKAEEASGKLVTHSLEEVMALLRRSKVGRFRTKRLRKKYGLISAR
jgi:predicted transcriptional regulator